MNDVLQTQESGDASEVKVSVTHRCLVCATDMHIETFDGEDWWVCNDIGCQWMEPA